MRRVCCSGIDLWGRLGQLGVRVYTAAVFRKNEMGLLQLQGLCHFVGLAWTTVCQRCAPACFGKSLGCRDSVSGKISSVLWGRLGHLCVRVYATGCMQPSSPTQLENLTRVYAASCCGKSEAGLLQQRQCFVRSAWTTVCQDICSCSFGKGLLQQRLGQWED